MATDPICHMQVDEASALPATVDGQTYYSRDFGEIEKMTRDFLAKYPRSHKREAAMFVLARAIYSLSCPYIVCVTDPTSGGGGDRMVDVVQKAHRVELFDSKRVLQALDNYDREFPNGRYAADVRDSAAVRRDARLIELRLRRGDPVDCASRGIDPV